MQELWNVGGVRAGNPESAKEKDEHMRAAVPRFKKSRRFMPRFSILEGCNGSIFFGSARKAELMVNRTSPDPSGGRCESARGLAHSQNDLPILLKDRADAHAIMC